MNKEEVQQRVLQYGKPLDLDKFEWDENTNTFSSDEDDLVLDFRDISWVLFDIGSDCIINTGYNCTFDTSYNCIINTGSCCLFKTGLNCTLNTGHGCTFDTNEDCVVVRKDVYEVIELNGLGKIKLNGYGIKGYTKLGLEETIQIGDHTYSKLEVEERLKGLKEL